MLFPNILYQFFVLEAFRNLMVCEQLQNISFSLSFLQGIFEKKYETNHRQVIW